MAARPNPKGAQIRSVQLTDREIRRIVRLASQEAQRLMESASTVRSAQLQLASMNAEMWAGVESVVKDGIGDAVSRSAQIQALFDIPRLEQRGITSAAWRASVEATARAGVDALISRKENGITLSQRVWRNSQAAQRGLRDTIDTGLLLGKSQREIARDVFKYVNPNTPGGASYAALRLGRTEVANAYHTSTLRHYRETPWVEECKWHLSGSHPRPDECNEYAESGSRSNGVWLVEEVPNKPHPQCLCYTTPVSLPLDEYARRFETGEFDDYIDAQLAHAGVAA